MLSILAVGVLAPIIHPIFQHECYHVAVPRRHRRTTRKSKGICLGRTRHRSLCEHTYLDFSAHDFTHMQCSDFDDVPISLCDSARSACSWRFIYGTFGHALFLSAAICTPRPLLREENTRVFLNILGPFFTNVAGMFHGMDEKAFREDLSSTSIRAGDAKPGL